MKKTDIIDVVEVEPGVYGSPTQIVAPTPKMSKKPKKEKAPIVDLVDGFSQGVKVTKNIFKIFGGL